MTKRSMGELERAVMDVLWDQGGWLTPGEVHQRLQDPPAYTTVMTILVRLCGKGRVERHRFVPVEEQPGAYTDYPLPIGFGQTISQPYIVAFMTEALDVGREHKVLEIGTGSGYQAAVLGELARDVFTIEIVDALAERSRELLAELGYRNVHVRAGNGYLGWPEEAPFDRIIVTAAPDQVPPALVDQLKMDGLIAVPVGVGEQTLQVLRRTPSGLVLLKALPVRFVPMVGKPK